MQRALLFILVILPSITYAQSWIPTLIADMPMATSNNSVCEAQVNGINYMFSFGGIDTTKVYTGIHQESFRYNVGTDTWNTIAPLPDTLGKIAGAASFVKDKIYIMGGYHVYSGGGELSSSRVHIYNPSTNNYEADGQAIPVPTDDHAQVVWRDSLVYLIGGWSNTTNIPDVQVYNPSSDSWQVGTSLPNTNLYKFFGAQATLLGDTIFYYGGAVIASNFPAFPAMRVGVIDATNPLNINWLPVQLFNGHPLYRSVGITNPDGRITFLGGSAASYNYNGLAYSNGLGVSPANEQIIYDPSDNQFYSNTAQAYPMDLRGLANVSSTVKYICGGMESNQVVSKKAFKLTYMSTVGTSDFAKEIGLKVYPNPVTNFVTVSFKKSLAESSYSIINVNGQTLQSGRLTENLLHISLEGISRGSYFLVLNLNGQRVVQAITKN